jgi:hypothetical protein
MRPVDGPDDQLDRPDDQRDGPDDQRRSPPWLWAALAALALLVLVAGAIVGMVTTDDGGDQPATSESGAQALPGAPPAAATLPPSTVPVPPITDVPTESGITVPSITNTTSTATTTVPAAGIGTWPAGRSGWTVILASVAEAQGRSEADAVAQRATAAGLPQVGVLLSTDYSTLRPGFWVTYTGVYGAESEARSALPTAQAAGFASAYPRRIAP